MKNLLILLVFLILASCGHDQKSEETQAEEPVKQASITDEFVVHNRNITEYSDGKEGIELDAADGDGMAWLKDARFTTGTIEFDVKGENVRGKSFVGVAFNGKDNENFEAIYFRPFNFLADNQDNRDHMVQYIHHPEFTWSRLREERTLEFETEIQNPPDPDDWFHAKVEVTSDSVKVYLNERPDAILKVERLSSYSATDIGYWVGFGSSGRFANLVIKGD